MLALDQYWLGSYADALSTLTQALDIDKSNAVLYASRASVYFAMNNYGAMYQDATTAIQLQPQFPDAYVKRAEALQSLGRLKDSTADLQRAINLDPFFGSAYYDEVYNYEQQGNRSSGADLYSLAMKLEPSSTLGFMGHGRTSLYGRDAVTAIIDFEAVLALDATNAEAYLHLGEAYIMQKRYTDALAALQNAINIAGPNKGCLACAYFDTGGCVL